VFSRCAATVNLIACLQDGVATGMTATSVCSLSLDPPSALICVNREARTRDAIVAAGTFVINVLSRGQEELANQFSRPGSDKAIPSELLNTPAGVAGPGAAHPVLRGVAGALMCRLENIIDFGSHSIMIGLVEQVLEGPADAEPLVYHDRRYVTTVADLDHLASRLTDESLISALGW
jgi:flavin reductase (DIM6/NTAB) family NADH-FMN oxidoreductase RutF